MPETMRAFVMHGIDRVGTIDGRSAAQSPPARLPRLQYQGPGYRLRDLERQIKSLRSTSPSDKAVEGAGAAGPAEQLPLRLEG